tara:strand:- start:675 stop:1130 length:456 start_codon:yes stop_codon:yes gene_type:complete
MNRYLNRTNVVLLLICFVSCTFAACASPAEFIAGTAAVGAGATTLLEVLKPILPPEEFAKLHAGVGAMDGAIETTKTVLGSVVDAFALFRDAVQAHDVAQTATINDQASTIAGMPGRTEVAAWGVGGGSGGTALSRILSMKKHGNIVATPA